MANAVEKAYSAIRNGILSGEFAAGSHLKEEELAVQIGVSRTPVREALRRLNAEDFVKFTPNHGAHVSSWTPEYVEEVFILRAKIEAYAAEVAATRIGADQIRKMEEWASRMEVIARQHDAGFLDEIAACNQKFHALLIDSTKSEHIARLLSWLVQMPIVLRTFENYGDDDLRRSLAHHREIIEALRVGDGRWAAAVMETHIYSARSAYLKARGGAETR